MFSIVLSELGMTIWLKMVIKHNMFNKYIVGILNIHIYFKCVLLGKWHLCFFLKVLCLLFTCILGIISSIVNLVYFKACSLNVLKMYLYSRKGEFWGWSNPLDLLSYFSFQPVQLASQRPCYVLSCWKVHTKDPLLLIRKNNPWVVTSGFSLLLSMSDTT